MATIKDVAKHAGVSVATVSRYLNSSGYISAHATQQIEQAIHALQYKPSQIARSLSKKQSNMIGLIVPDIKNPYFPELARAVEDTAWAYDYTVVLCNSDEKQQKELLYVERLSQKYVAGLIVTTSLTDTTPYEEIKIPIVALDRAMNAHIPTVMTNNKEGAKMATTHLVACGAKNLLCLSGPRTVQTALERLQGFEEIVMQHRLPYDVVETPFKFDDAAKAVREALMHNPAIDSIFASSDTSAIAALHIAHELGRHVPNELQIVGFDGIALSEMVSPPLTTVSQNLYEIGAAATEMLIAQIEGKPLVERQKIVEAQLIVRATTRKDRIE